MRGLLGGVGGEVQKKRWKEKIPGLCTSCLHGWTKLPGASEENGPITLNSEPGVVFQTTLRGNDNEEQFECREGQVGEYAHDGRR